MRCLVLGAFLAAMVYGEDITLPLDGGSILIQNPRFIRVNRYGSHVPELAFTLKNLTTSPWRTLRLRFDIVGLCNGEPRQWTMPVNTSLGWAGDHEVVTKYADTVIPLVGKADGCKAEVIKASLLFAESFKTRIDGVTGDRVDLEEELREVEAKLKAEAVARAEQEQSAAEERIEEARRELLEIEKRGAEDTARRKRLEAEQKRKQAEDAARYARMKAAEDAKAAEERRAVRTACTVIYKNTADKRIGDLTVKEDQQVKACQALGLYPPR